jgi:hypothetical protein
MLRHSETVNNDDGFRAVIAKKGCKVFDVKTSTATAN